MSVALCCPGSVFFFFDDSPPPFLSFPSFLVGNLLLSGVLGMDCDGFCGDGVMVSFFFSPFGVFLGSMMVLATYDLHAYFLG